MGGGVAYRCWALKYLQPSHKLLAASPPAAHIFTATQTKRDQAGGNWLSGHLIDPAMPPFAGQPLLHPPAAGWSSVPPPLAPGACAPPPHPGEVPPWVGRRMRREVAGLASLGAPIFLRYCPRLQQQVPASFPARRLPAPSGFASTQPVGGRRPEPSSPSR